MRATPDEQELLEVALAAAHAAGGELLRRFGGEAIDVRTKSTDTDPVSAADLAAERAIRAVLAARRPDDAILGEEGGATDGHGSGLRWVVDPLDGTVNYLYGIPQWAVSVACEDADGGVAGVVLDPVRGECFTATRGGPPLRDGQPMHASAVDRLDRALVATGFGYDPRVRRAQAAVVAAVLPRARDIRRAGAAALDLCACACGRVDAYYERGVKPWDVAAGALLCARAGLDVRRLPAVSGPPAAIGAGGVAGGVDLPEGIVVAPAGLIDELYALVA